MKAPKGLVPTAAVAAGVVGAAAVAERLVVSRAQSRGRSRAPSGPPPAESVELEADDGGRIHLLVRGEGRPLVLVHGVTLAAEVWYHQLDDLSDSFRVVAVDLRGHGRSQGGSDPLELPRLGADLAAVAEQLHLRDAVLVGHSLGGMAALRLAHDRPDLFRDAFGALMLMSTSSGPLTPVPPEGWRRAVSASRGPVRHNLEGLARRSRGLLTPGSAGFLGARIVFGAKPSAADVEFTRRLTASTSPVTFADLWESMLTVDLRTCLPTLDLPTTVVVGSRDLLTPPGRARAMMESLPNAELVVLPGCGHMPMLERRADTERLIRRLGTRRRGDRPPGQAGEADAAGGGGTGAGAVDGGEEPAEAAG